MGDPFKTTVRVECEPMDLAVNNWQLHWATALAALMHQAAAARATARAEAAARAAPAAAAEQAPAAAGADGADAVAAAAAGHAPQPPGAAAAAAGPAAGGVPGYKGSAVKPATKALGVFGRVWDYVVDEARYVEGIEGGRVVGAIWRVIGGLIVGLMV